MNPRRPFALARAWMRDMWIAPNPPERNPMIFFLVLTIAVITGPTAVGFKSLPGSLQDAPDLYGQFTAIGLCLGSCICLAGILWLNRDTGLALELTGKIVLGIGSLFYCIALLLMGQGNATLAAANSGGIALGCLARSIQIGLYVRNRWAESDQRPEHSGR